MKSQFKMLFVLAAAALIIAFKPAGEVETPSFEMGEKLSYKVKYDLYINVPVAQMDFIVNDELKEFNGQKCLHLKAVGKTYRFYDNFFKVRDYFDAYVDPNTFTPRLFTRNILEGKYKKKDYVLFYPEEQYVKTQKGKKHEIPQNTWDILSIWYMARSFNYDDMQPGDSVGMNTFIDDESYPIGLQYIGKENVKTRFGSFDCHVIKPTLIAGEIFKSESEMTLWVSADQNKIPVMIESGISVGKVKAELSAYSGLKHPVSSLKAK